MTSISKGNANLHKMALLWPCLPDPGGPFCVGLVHLHFIETWGGGQAKHRKGQAGILCGFALPFENVGLGFVKSS